MELFESVLVTGCGGDIGQGVCKILKTSGYVGKVIGCDIHDDHPGALVFDSCETVPRADDKGYFPSILKIVKKHNIDLIIPLSEAEIAQYVEHSFAKVFENVPVLLANERAIRIGLDKLKTVNSLKTHGLAYPWTEVVENGAPYQIPCVLKMRFGQGSKNFVKIMDSKLVGYYRIIRPKDLWQEMLLPDTEEYTCGIFQTGCGEIRTVVINRKLQGDVTGSGIVVQNDYIEKYLKQIAVLLDLQGSINVQLRLTERGPVAFEINPRFSSTVVFRHLMGFQDLIWSLKELRGLPLEPFRQITPGLKLYRGACEYIVGSPIPSEIAKAHL